MESLFKGDGIFYAGKEIKSDIYEKLIPIRKEGNVHIFTVENLEIDCADKSNKV